MDKEILDDIKEEGVDELQELLGDEQEETTEDSSPEETEESTDSEQSEDKEETEEETVPFHKHPRWKQMQDDNKALREQIESQSGLAEKVEQIQQSQSNQDESLPKWWTTLYGNDDTSKTAYTEYNSHETDVRASIKQEIVNEQKAQVQQQNDESKKWDDWVDSEIDTLKAEGKTFDRNALMKVATEWQPTDANGNVSLRKSLEILEMQTASKEKPNTERKKVAALTSSNNQGASDGTTKVLTSQQMRGSSMQSLINRQT